MVVLYYVVRLLLNFVHGYVGWRASRAEDAHEVVSAKAEEAVEKQKAGTPAAPGTLEFAVGQNRLMKIAEAKEEAESRWAAWQASSERLGNFRAWLAGYRGRLCPYLASHVDAIIGLVVAEYCGWGASRVIAIALTVVPW